MMFLVSHNSWAVLRTPSAQVRNQVPVPLGAGAATPVDEVQPRDELLAAKTRSPSPELMTAKSFRGSIHFH